MKVKLELQNGHQIIYQTVDRIEDSDRYQITIYNENGILAIVNKGEIKSLISEEC